MVAIVSGNGTGLDLTSKGVLGGQGVTGDPTFGQGNENVYVNAANGNLVIQQLQDTLVGAGLDIGSVLTYNSQGTLGGDNFSLGNTLAQAGRGQLALSGTRNASGSALTVTTFDGSQQVYTWDGTRYTSTAGAGAFDTITYDSGTNLYTRIDGSTQQTDIYDGTLFLLKSSTDAQGNTLTFTYLNHLLKSVSNSDSINGTAAPETITYDYDGNGNLLHVYKTTDTGVVNSGVPVTSTQTLVTYAYDTSNRLTDVTTLWTPQDGTSVPNEYFRTTYTYTTAVPSTSKYIATITQSEGPSLTALTKTAQKLTITYAGNQVARITDALGNYTSFAYSGNTTSVRLNGTTGPATVYTYDATTKQLLSVAALPPVTGAASPTTVFAYDPNGNVTTITDPAGRAVHMTYDPSGNLLSKLDADGVQTVYTYDGKNRLLTQTSSTLATPAMTNFTNITAADGTLTRSGAAAGWTATAYSANGIAGGAAVSFSMNVLASGAIVGLTTDPVGTSYAGIDWGMYCMPGGALQVRENGVPVDLATTWSTNDTLSVRYDGTQVTYLLDGNVVRRAAASIDGPLYAAVALYTPNMAISNLRFGAVASSTGDEVNLQGVPLMTTAGSGALTIAGDTVTKASTGASGFDASARGNMGLVGGAAASFTATSTGKYVMVGLDSSAGDDPTDKTLDFAAYLRADGSLVAVKDGIQLAIDTSVNHVAGTPWSLTPGSTPCSLCNYHAGDRISVVYDGANTVSWLDNGVVVGTYTTPAVLTSALFLDSSFGSPGASVTGLRFGGFGAVDPIGKKVPPVMTNSGGVLVNGGTLTKTGGTNGAWDASARSALSLSGGAQVAFSVVAAGDLSIGLNSDPDSSPSYASMDYCFKLTSGNLLEAWAGGVKVASLGNYAVGQRLVLRSDGVNVTWTVDGTDQATIAVIGSGEQPLYVDTSFASSGASITDLIFDSGQPVASATTLPIARLSGVTNATFSGGTVTKSASGVGGAWDSGVQSTNGIVGGAAVAFTTSSNAQLLAIGLSAVPGPSNDFATIDYAFYVKDDGTLWAYQDGVSLTATKLGNYAAGDRLSVSYGANGVSWMQNGKVLFTKAVTITAALYLDASFATAGAKVTCMSFGSSDMADPFADGDAPPLKSGPNVVVSGGDVTKVSGADSTWNATASSTYGYIGGATASFTAETPNLAVAVGLNTDPATSASYAKIDYGFYLQNNGLVSLCESNTFIRLNIPYSAGDRFSVSYDGKQVSYVMNGQVVYVTPVASPITQPLYLDSSFFSLGAKVSDLNFVGGASPDETTRYVYDDAGKGLLRYTISPAGRVTEYGYNSAGALISTNEYVQASYSMVGLSAGTVPSESDMNLWRGLQDRTLTQRTDIARDWRQQITSTTAYGTTNANGTGAQNQVVTSFAYDAAGRLVQKTQGGALTSYAYDGLGRLTLTTDPLQRKTTTQYQDAYAGGLRVTITTKTADGTKQVTSVESFDQAGRLTGVSTTGTGVATSPPTTYAYDAAGNLLRTTDATGVQTWSLYDADNRKVADIDGEGVLTEYDYDAGGLVTREIVHGTKLTSSQLVTLGQGTATPTNPSLATLGVTTFNVATDRVTWNVYDDAGRLRQTIGAAGAVINYDYDGAGRLATTTAFAKPIDVSTLGTASVVAFLTTVTTPPVPTGSVLSSADDRISRNYYDPDGLLVGTLDPDRYLTTYEYDGEGRLTVTTRHATQVPGTGFAESIDEMLPAPSIDDQRSVTLYDLMGRVSGQIDAEGYLTETYYDTNGNMSWQTRFATQVGTAVAAGTSVTGITPVQNDDNRGTGYTYDADNRLSQVTNYEGTVTTYGYADLSDAVVSTDVVASQVDQTSTQSPVDALGHVLSQTAGGVGVTYAYDLAGRRVSMTDANGHSTYYFYDNDGRLRFTVDPTRAVQELQYDAFGQVTRTLRYKTTIPTSTAIGGGGLITSALTNAVNALGTPTTTTTTYLLNGLAKSVTDAMGYTTTNLAFDAFGDVTSRMTGLSGGRTRTDVYTYDHRGDALTSLMDQGGLAVTGSASYDAFGRQVSSTDGKGTLTTMSYDRLGDVIQRTDALTPASTWTYDAFGQVLSASKNGGDPTTYVYNRAAGSVTVTPPDAAAGSVTTHDALGRVSSVKDANGHVTGYTYDAAGHLTGTKIDGTPTYAATYDNAGHLVSSQDGQGVAAGAWTHYTYDADDRLQYVVDPTGGVTKHEYDALGREMRTTRYVNKIQTLPTSGTAITSAQVVVTASPTLDQVTTRCFDASDRMTYSVDGTGAVTKYVYGDGDTLLQRVRYNSRIDLTAWTDITGDPPVTPSTGVGREDNYDRYESWTYDAFDRVTLAVDASGSATGYTYDANGNVLTRRQYANTNAVADPVNDRVTRKVYDADNRVVLSVDPSGAVTQFTYDADGNVTQVRQFTQPVGVGYSGTDADLLALMALRTASTDLVSASLYDARDRLSATVDSSGAVTQYTYDAVGNATQVVQRATLIPGGGTMTPAALQAAIAALAHSGLDRITTNVYDGLNRLTWTGDALGRVTSIGYDATGNVISRTQYVNTVAAGADPSTVIQTGGRVSRYVYDGANRVLLAADARGAVTGTTYDGAGNVVAVTQYVQPDTNISAAGPTVTPGADGDRTTRMTYDGAGRVRYQGDPLGYVTRTDYDGFGDAITITRYFKPVTGTNPSLVTSTSGSDLATNQYFNADGMLYMTDDGGLRTRHAYDNFGQLAYTVTADGAVTRNDYDLDGRVLRTTRYATALDPGVMSTLSTRTGPGTLATLASAKPGQDGLAVNAYDVFGRVLFSMDGTGAVTETRYDAAGNVSDRIAYAAPPTTAWNGIGTPACVGDSAHDRHAHMSYDAFGDVLAQADGTGAVTVNVYDAAGQLTDRTRYANPIAIQNWTSGTLPADINADTTRDIHERYEYDTYGELAFQADGTGAITALTYDASGNLIQRQAYVNPAVAGTKLKDIFTTSADRSERFEFDLFGAQTWHSDPAGSLTQTHYDLDGRVDRTTQFAIQVSGAITHPTPTAGVDRTTTRAYDAFGRLQYQQDARGYLTMNVYDTHGRLSTQTRYASAQAIPTGTATPTLGADETTSWLYDGVGRVSQRTDALGGVQSFSYDGLGDKVRFTDEKSQVWTYAYDGAGREKSEMSPTVYVTTNAATLGQDLVDTSGTYKLVKTWVYDGVGNVRTCVAGIYQAVNSDDSLQFDSHGNAVQYTSQARTTTYTYDADGRVITTTLPADDVYDNTGTKQGSSPQSAMLRTVYDAFGNVVASVDALGHATYSTYDQANRLRFTIVTTDRVDPNVAIYYVVGYDRDIFGEVTTQTAYGQAAALTENGNPLDTSAANLPKTIDVQKVVSALSPDTNRVTTTNYYQNGLVQTTWGGLVAYYGYDPTNGIYFLGQSPKKTFSYDAFGDVTRESALYNATANSGAGYYGDTLHYYDLGGNETDTVDAAGYLTHRDFDAFGNATKATEYANATSGSTATTGATIGTVATPTPSPTAGPGDAGVDRVTTATYDKLNRKTAEARHVDYSASDDGTVTGNGLTTYWHYDAQGHVTFMQDAAGNKTYSMYDALGQLRAVIHPSRSSTVDGSTVTPATGYFYDAFGNVTWQADYAASAAGAGEFTGAWTLAGAFAGSVGYTLVSNPGDRVTRTMYDAQDHVVQVDDPMADSAAVGHNTIYCYDLAGRLVFTQHQNFGNDGLPVNIYQRYTYDARNQVFHVFTRPTDTTVANGVYTQDTYSTYAYNAFGEVVSKGIGNQAQEHFDYDNNGWLWRTNSGDGVYHVYLRDMVGEVVSDMTSDGSGSGRSNIDLSTLLGVGDVFAKRASLRQTNTARDMVGNIVTVAQPGRSTGSGGTAVLAGATTWTAVTMSGSTASTTVSFPDVSLLGTGEMKFDITYVTPFGTTVTTTVYRTDPLTTSAALSFSAIGGATAISSILVSKKNTVGDWQALNAQSTGSQTLVRTQVLIAAPDDPAAKVSMSYMVGSSSVSAGLVNFGDAYWFDASTLGAGTYTDVVTIKAADGTLTTVNGSFTVGQASANTASTIFSVPVSNQVFDRWGNLLSRSDPRAPSWITKYQYNANNQVTVVQQPDPAGTLGLDGKVIAGPTTKYFYDRAGNQIAVLDPRSTSTAAIVNGKVYDAAGNVVRVDNADGTHTTSAYDIFGELQQSVSANGYKDNGAQASNIADYTTLYGYDMLGELTSEQHGAGSGNVKAWMASGALASLAPTQVGGMVNLTDTYTYDADGNRLTSSDGSRSSADNTTVLVTSYKYDAADHLVETDEPLMPGQTIATANKVIDVYDDFGHKKSETDENGRTATWQYDYFGHELLQHKDFGGFTYAYTYDNAAQLTLQTNNRTVNQNITYAYDAAGQMTRASDTIDATNGEVTSYVYDAAGRHLQETTLVNGQVFQDNHIAYDADGRIIDSSDSAVHLSFIYDAAGNRLEITSHVIADGEMGTATTGASKDLSSDRFYTYDAMNRMIDADWTSSASAGTGHTLTYDHDGNRKTDTFTGRVVTTSQALNGYDAYGDAVYSGSGTSTATDNATVVETYAYDADDRLTTTQRNGIQVDNRLYDFAGRVVMDGTNGHLPTGYQSASIGTYPNMASTNFNTQFNAYDNHGNLLGQRVIYGDGTANYTIDNSSVGSGSTQTRGYDAAGNLVGSLKTFGDTANHTDTTTTTFDIGESYKSKVQTDVTVSGGNTSTVTTTTTYDSNDLIRQVATTGAATKIYSNDIGGQILRSYSAPNLDMRNVIVNGEVIGSYGLNSDGTAATANPTIDFEFGYHSMDEAGAAAGVGSYTVQLGDTLESIAFSAYGDSNQWRRIAQANGLHADTDLKVGQTLKIPRAGSSGSHNDASTYTPYEPWKIMGATVFDPVPPAALRPSGAPVGSGRRTIIPVTRGLNSDGEGVTTRAMATTATASASAPVHKGIPRVGQLDAGDELELVMRLQGTFYTHPGGGGGGGGGWFGTGNAGYGDTDLFSNVSVDLSDFSPGDIFDTTTFPVDSTGGSDSFVGTLSAGGDSNVGNTLGNAGGSSGATASNSIPHGLSNPAVSDSYSDAIWGVDGSGLGWRSSNSARDDDPTGTVEYAGGVTRTGEGGWNGVPYASEGDGTSSTTATGGPSTGGGSGDIGNAQGSGPYSSTNYQNGSDIESTTTAAGDPQELARFAGAGAQATAPLIFAQAHAAGLAATTITPDDVARMGAMQPRTSVVVGAEGAEGYWGVSKAMLPSGASDAQVQQGVLQLMTANSGKTTLQLGDSLSLGNGSIANSAVQTYAGMNASYQAGLVQRLTSIASNASAGAIGSLAQGPMFAAPQLDTWIDSPFAGQSFNDIAPSDTIRPADSGLNYVLADFKAAWNGKVSWSDAASMAWNIGGNEAVGAIGHGLTAGVAYTLAAASSWTGVAGVGFGLFGLQQSDAAVAGGMDFIGVDDSPSYFDRGLSTMLSSQAVAAVDKEIDLAAGAISFGALSASEAAASASRITALRMDPSNYAHTLDLLPSNWYDSPQAINIAPTPQNAEGLAELLANETSAEGAGRGMAGVLIDQYGNVRFGLSAKPAAPLAEGGVNIPQESNQFMRDLTNKNFANGYEGFNGYCAEPDAYSRFLNVSDLFDSENAVMGTAQIHEPVGFIRPACENCAQVHQFFSVAYRDEAVGSWVTMPQSYSFTEARFSLVPSLAGQSDPRDQNSGSPYHP